MIENVFFDGRKKYSLEDYMNYETGGRGNLGEQVPLTVYRLLEYSLREELEERLGKEAQVEIMRCVGKRAGIFFAKKLLDMTLPMNEFLAQFQAKIAELKIGVARIEMLDKETGKMILTVSEDADCSGLPLLGETVCNYDEGFIAGIMSAYTGKEYMAEEIDCWATGDRVCRFHVEVKEQRSKDE